jgi:hypothetical protein
MAVRRMLSTISLTSQVRRTLLAGIAGLTIASSAVLAQDLRGTKSISLQTTDGTLIRVGAVTFVPAVDGGYTFTVQIDSKVFTDHFLSMKEFKCLGGAPELMCWVPYPYRSGTTITEKDFAWLEHSLLFMFKRPSDFGAKLWNGVYFQLSRTSTGLLGKPQAVDLNQISAPPSDLAVPPFKPGLRDDYPQGSRWIRSMSIE